MSYGFPGFRVFIRQSTIIWRSQYRQEDGRGATPSACIWYLGAEQPAEDESNLAGSRAADPAGEKRLVTKSPCRSRNSALFI